MENAPEFMDLQRAAADEPNIQPTTEIPTLDLGRIGYEAYRAHTGGFSLAHGGPLPEWSGLAQKYVKAWNAAAFAIHEAVAKKAMQDVLADLALVETPDRVPTQPEHPTPEQVIFPVQKPSIGRIVIYHELAEDGLFDSPAIIFHVADGGVHLWVFNFNYPDQPRFATYGTGAGQWSWPERVGNA